MKFRPNSLTLRANVDVFSLETVRSPALMWISKPGVAPLSRAYPRLDECRPFRTLASRRDQTQRSLFLHAIATKRRKNKRLPALVANWFTKWCAEAALWLEQRSPSLNFHTPRHTIRTSGPKRSGWHDHSGEFVGGTSLSLRRAWEVL